MILLVAFVFAIPPTFHGDEAMQIYMSRDYATAFIDHNPSALITSPPYSIDTDAYLRLINGTINRYAIGLSWQIAGLNVNDLPPRPGWDWGLDYTTNVNTGHMPSPALLAASRFSSTLFLALSVIVMFAFGWQFGKRPLAYFVSALYAINPVTLLDGRRALQEGSLLFFGLLTILLAVWIAKRRRDHKSTPILLWLALIGSGGLALASKDTGIVYIAAALGWIFFAEFTHLRWGDLILTTLKLIVSGLLMIALFIALSPALWSNPPARLIDMLQQRAQLLDIQVKSDANAPMPLALRVQEIALQPFMTPPQHFEVAFWATFKPVTDDIAHYMSSPFSGLQFGLILGGLLTLLAVIGIVFSLRGDWRSGIFAWLLVVVASSLANPLPWQRYYLPLYPLASLLVGIGVHGLIGLFVRKPEQQAALSHAAP